MGLYINEYPVYNNPMTTNTITLTAALRTELESALIEARDGGMHGDHQGYLDTLAATPDGTEIAATDELADPLEYFCIHNF